MRRELCAGAYVGGAVMLPLGKKRLFGIISVAVAVASFILYYWFSGTPWYSLWQIRRSVLRHDVEGFERYVDIPEITDRMLDPAMDLVKEQYRKEMAGNPFAGLGEVMLMAFQPTAKELVRQYANEQLTRLIENGTIADASFDIVRVETVVTSGKLATVELVRTDRKPFVEGVQTVRLKMRQMGDRRWKVIEVPTLTEWMVDQMRLAYDDPETLKQRFGLTRLEANERSVLGHLRTITTAAATYRHLHPTVGFPKALAQLVEADLIYAPKYRGYSIVYEPRIAAGEERQQPRGNKILLKPGQVVEFTLLARPLEYDRSGRRSFFTDGNYIIHYTSEDRPATTADPVVE